MKPGLHMPTTTLARDTLRRWEMTPVRCFNQFVFLCDEHTGFIISSCAIRILTIDFTSVRGFDLCSCWPQFQLVSKYKQCVTDMHLTSLQRYWLSLLHFLSHQFLSMLLDFRKRKWEGLLKAPWCTLQASQSYEKGKYEQQTSSTSTRLKTETIADIIFSK